MVLAFWPTLASLPDVWSRYTYAHGYLIPPLVLWLAWRRRDALLRPVRAGAGAGMGAILPLVLLSLVWFVAVVTNVQVIHQWAFPLILLLWVAVIAGWHAARRLLPAAVVFMFTVPFWEVFTRPLQLLTIAVNGWLVRALGIEAEITGEYVFLPTGTFEIAGSCAGLNFFIVGLLVGLLYAHLFVTRWRTRLAVVAVAVGLAIVGNWIRVTGLVIIGDATDMQWAYLEDHGTYGWIIFIVVMVIFFPIAGYLAKRETAGRAAARAEAGAGANEDGTSAAHDEAASPADSPAHSTPPPGTGAAFRNRTLLATGLAVLGPLTFFALSAAPAASLEAGAEPTGGDGWTRQSAPDSAPHGWAPAFPTPDRRREAVWSDGSTELHQLVLVYESQEQGRELVGADSRIARSRDLAFDRSLWIAEKEVLVREALVRTPDGHVVVWYWYEVGGVRAAYGFQAKALELWAFVRRRPAAALVTLSTECVSDGCQVERAALRAFVQPD
jgi:exosortase A